MTALIQGYCEQLAKRMDGPREIEAIRQQVGELTELGEDARTIEQLALENGPSREVVDIRSILTHQLDGLEDVYPDVEITTRLPDKGVEIYAHPLIDSAVRNLLTNAIEHNDKDTPRISVECTISTQNDGDHVVVRIADNGPGIPERELAVLERGYETQLEHTSGLGLWLVNWIVSESEGEVNFEKNEPRGSIVSLQFEAATTVLEDG